MEKQKLREVTQQNSQQQGQQQQKITENTSAEAFQKLCMFINIVLLFPGAYFFNMIFQFIQETNEKNPENPTEHLQFYIFITQKCWFDMIFRNLDTTKYITLDEQILRANQITSFIYSAIYYSISSIAGYCILQQLPFFDKLINFQTTTEIITVLEEKNAFKIPYLKEYLYVSFGWQIYNFIIHFQKQKKNTFWEMVLHHNATLCVMISAFSIRQYVVAGYVLLIHDFSDIFIFIARFASDFKQKYNILIYTSYFTVLMCWIIVRIFNYPMAVLNSIYLFVSLQQSQDEYFNLFVTLCKCDLVLLTILLFLHVYWIYVMLLALYIKLIKKIEYNEMGLKKQK